MKKLILALTVAAFSFGAYAGEGCADAAKANATASCPASKAQCPASGATAEKGKAAKKVVQSPKGQQQANKS